MGNSLAVQWLGLRASTAGGRGSIPGRGTKIPHAAWQKKKKKSLKIFRPSYNWKGITFIYLLLLHDFVPGPISQVIALSPLPTKFQPIRLSIHFPSLGLCCPNCPLFQHLSCSSQWLFLEIQVLRLNVNSLEKPSLTTRPKCKPRPSLHHPILILCIAPIIIWYFIIYLFVSPHKNQSSMRAGTLSILFFIAFPVPNTESGNNTDATDNYWMNECLPFHVYYFLGFFLAFFTGNFSHPLQSSPALSHPLLPPLQPLSSRSNHSI